MLIILSANSSPADWVSILPYITSLHSSSRVCACARTYTRARVFLLPSFFQITSHFPPGFLGDVPGDAVCKVMRSNMKMGRQNNALRKKKKKWWGWGGKFEKKTRQSSCLLRIWLRVDAKLQFGGGGANEAVDKYLITPTTNT